MKVKNIFLLSVYMMVLFASCSKTDSGGGTPTPPTPVPVVARTIIDTSYGPDAKQRMDIYLPASRSATNTKVLVLIHGGSWTGGDKSDFNLTIIDTLKKRLPDYAIFNLNYRLAALPATNPFPTQELDIKSAVEFIYNNRAGFLVGDKFVTMGVSAGAHLALLHAYKYNAPVKVKAVVDFFGPTNMVGMYNDYAGTPAQLGIIALMSGTPASNPSLYQSSSPFTYATTPNACPTIILQGGNDVVVYPTQSSTLRDKLTSAGVINQYVLYPTGGHGDWDVATYTDAFNKIQAFLGVHVP
jgi:acetyl esterase/lipase